MGIPDQMDPAYHCLGRLWTLDEISRHLLFQWEQWTMTSSYGNTPTWEAEVAGSTKTRRYDFKREDGQTSRFQAIPVREVHLQRKYPEERQILWHSSTHIQCYYVRPKIHVCRRVGYARSRISSHSCWWAASNWRHDTKGLSYLLHMGGPWLFFTSVLMPFLWYVFLVMGKSSNRGSCREAYEENSSVGQG